jgi:hypothetical protein
MIFPLKNWGPNSVNLDRQHWQKFFEKQRDKEEK